MSLGKTTQIVKIRHKSQITTNRMRRKKTKKLVIKTIVKVHKTTVISLLV